MPGGGVAEILGLAEVEGFAVLAVFVGEVEFLLPLPGVEHDHGVETAPEFAAETFEGADALFHEEGDDFLALEFAAGHAFPNEEFALGVGAFVGLEALFEALAAAFGARDFEVMEVPLDDGAHAAADFADDVGGEPADLLHEGGAGELAALHLAELVLPFAGEFGLGERFGFEAAEEGDEGESFGGDDEVAALADEVALEDEALDDLRPGGRGAEAALAHGFAEFLVVDELAGAFHGGEERAFVEAGGRFGDVLFHLHGLGPRALAFGHGDDGFVVLAVALGLLAIDGEPAGIDDDFAVGLELLADDGGDARGDLELRGRVKDGDEAAGDEVVDLGFGFAQPAGHGAGGDDGKVIADFGVVEDAFVRVDVAFAQRFVGVDGE